MKLPYMKYIFSLSVTIIIGIIAVAFSLPKEHAQSVRASVTTPLISTFSAESSLCEGAKSAVLIDAKSGAVLFEKRANTRLPMASTTKIMTALCVIEKSTPDTFIKVSEHAANTEGSSIYLTSGETISVKDLLYGLMLESGNDAAVALAEGVFGSEEKCLSYMNQRCHEMGLINTSFESVSGLDKNNHFTTAYELALIASKAMQNDFFREIVRSKNYITSGEKTRYFSNHNRLLSSFEGACGIKTGYTKKSGRCLVSCAELNGCRYIAVTLNDGNDWKDHKEMLSFALDNYTTYEIASKDVFTVFNGLDRYTPLQDIYITAEKGHDFDISYKIRIDKSVALAEYFSGKTRLGTFTLEKADFSHSPR